MHERLARLARGAALLAMVAGLAFPGIGYAEKSDEDRKRDKEDKAEQRRSEKEDRELAGQVLEINTLKNPPELYIANADGIVTVRMLKTDEIARNGVRLGDHVSFLGEKVHELLFDADQLSVDGHLGDEDDEDDDD